MNLIYWKLNYGKLKEMILSNKNDIKREILIQGLKWRLSRSCNIETRRISVEEMTKNDILDIKNNGLSRMLENG